MRKFTVVFLMEIFVLGIVLGRFHGYESYNEYYNNRVNGGQLQHPKIASYEIKEYHDANDIKKEVKSRFEDNNEHATKNSFKFPDEWQMRNGDDNYAGVTRCDYIKQTFCENVPNYPQEFVNRILAQNSSLLQYARQDIIAVSPRLDDEEAPLCLSTERLIYPKTAVNMENQWHYIIQSEQFIQSVRIEVCKEEDAKCKLIDGFAEKYVTSCKQKYIYRELLAIIEGHETRDYFRIPASCCCHIQLQVNEEKKKKDRF